jgi:hypothetical protein
MKAILALIFLIGIPLFLVTGCSKDAQETTLKKDWVSNSDYDFPVYVGKWGCIMHTSADDQFMGYSFADTTIAQEPDSLQWTLLTYHEEAPIDTLKSILSANAIQKLIGIQNSSNKDLNGSGKLTKNFNSKGVLK